MFIIDFDKKCAVNNLSFYLTPREAKSLIEQLGNLLKNPEANEHFHLYDERGESKEISCSLITGNKLKDLERYNEIERKILSK